MAAPEDRPEIAKLKDDITIPTALVQLVRPAQRAVLFLVSVAAHSQDSVLIQKAFARRSACPPPSHLPELNIWMRQHLVVNTVPRKVSGQGQAGEVSLRCSCAERGPEAQGCAVRRRQGQRGGGAGLEGVCAARQRAVSRATACSMQSLAPMPPDGLRLAPAAQLGAASPQSCTVLHDSEQGAGTTACSMRSSASSHCVVSYKCRTTEASTSQSCIHQQAVPERARMLCAGQSGCCGPAHTNKLRLTSAT